MAKRIFAALLVSVLVAVPASEVSAQKQTIAIDGCAKLARAVYDEVASAAIDGPTQSGPWRIDIGNGDISICGTAAETVSRAFTSAMRSAGISVDWGRFLRERFWPDSGDFCWSGFLSQCYPERDRMRSDASSDPRALVQERWYAVSRAVMAEMYNPYSSDEVHFREDDLRLRLGLALRTVRVATVAN